MNRLTLDWRTASPDIAAAAPGTAILNLASTEQHGPHLPVGTDLIIGQHLARAVAERLGAYLLPSIPIGTCQEHMGRAGTVWIGPETLYALVKDIVLSLRAQGLSKVVIITSHGGLWIVKPAVRELNLNFPGLTVLLVDPYAPAILPSGSVLEGHGIDLHAGEAETSLILHLDPETVHMDRLIDCQPQVGREFLDYVPVSSVCPGGVWGRATLATAEKGHKLFALMVEGVVRYCSESFAKVAELKLSVPEGCR